MKKHITNVVIDYFRFLARLQLKKFAPDIVGITGSAGKTSCRNAVTAILKDKYPTKVSYKSNSETGIPLNILGLTPHNYSISDWLRLIISAPTKLLTNWQPYHKYIVEMGIDGPRPPQNMSYLLSIIRPRTAIFLNALPVHTQNFDTLIKGTTPRSRQKSARQAIASEKGKLITSLPENGLAILNADDPYVYAFSNKTKAKVMTFGTQSKNHVQIASVKSTLTGTKFTFQSNQETHTLHLKDHILPHHFGHTLAAAICIGLDEDFTLKESVELILKHFTLPPGRATIIKGINQSTIIDSSYNASAQPTIDLFDLLKTLKSRRKLCLLGDLRELGEEAQLEHSDVAIKAAQICDQVFLTGPLMKKYALPILTNKLGTSKASWHQNADQTASVIKTILKKGDVLLVKGSQNTIFLEAAVKVLMQHPEKSKATLCRQTSFWTQKRQDSGLLG